MNRAILALALGVVVLIAPDLPRTLAATPDVPFLGARDNPTLPDSYMPGKKLNTYTAAEWAAGAFTLQSGNGLASLQDVGVAYTGMTPLTLADAGLVTELLNPANKKKVSIRTKSDLDHTFLYVAFEVEDSSPPDISATSGPLDGDRVIIMIDPENNKAPPAARSIDTRFRISYQVPRTSDATGRVIWSKRTGDGSFVEQAEATYPANFKIAVLKNDLGYSVGMQIPLKMVGVSARQGDFGLGFAVINATSNKLGGANGDRLSFAISYPNSDGLHPTSTNLPQNDDDSIGPGWEDQAKWGTGYLRGDLSTIVIRDNPPNYHSQDIRIGTEAATKFDDIKAYSVDSNTNWYKYKAADPCKGRFWAQVHRKVPATPAMPAARDVKARVLFLWGPAGVPPVELYYIGVSDPFLIRRDTTDREMYKPVLWDKPVKGLPGHPCVVAVVLPDILDKGTYDAAKFTAFDTHLQTKADPYSAAERVNVKVNLDDLVMAYSLTKGEQVAQMNVDPKGDFTCPGAVPVPNRPEPDPTPPPIGLRPLGPGALTTALVFGQPPDKPKDTDRPQKKGGEPLPDPRDVLVDFEGFAFVRPAGKNKTVIIEPLGGVRKLVSADFLKKSDPLILTFNVTNTAKVAREITVGHYTQFPPELKGYRVDLPSIGGTFQPGETRTVEAVLTSRPPSAPNPCPPVLLQCCPGAMPQVARPTCRSCCIFRCWR
jgi:Carbohydrate family 9 binding domain-like